LLDEELVEFGAQCAHRFIVQPPRRNENAVAVVLTDLGLTEDRRGRVLL
jgi:hypothetical protein